MNIPEPRPLNIAIDVDGTLINTHQVFVKVFHERHPDKNIPDHADMEWDMWDTFGINKKEVYEIFAEMRERNHYKYCAPCDSNFVMWMNQLIADGHNCFILTANPPEFEPLLRYWLTKYGLKDIEIIFTDSIEAKKDIEFDILIDDSPNAYKMMAWDVGQQKKLLLYNQPWNASVEEKRWEHVYRVFNWRDVKEMVDFFLNVEVE